MSNRYEIPPDLRRLLDREGVEIVGSREIDYATQYRLARNDEAEILNVYRTGKISTGSKPSGLRDLLEGWRSSRYPTKRTGYVAETRDPSGTRPILSRRPRTGIDEAGKGDYFGPLVVAGVRVLGQEAAKALLELGVRDSKTLGASTVQRMAVRIPEAAGTENVRVLALPPQEYETRRARAGNVNRLLDELDAGIIDELKAEIEIVVVDQYAASARENLAPFVPDGVRLEVRTGAEDDAAVAAASILARARFLEEMDRLSKQVGFKLPLGASQVVGAARRVYKERGMEGLRKVAKVSFRTTRNVTGGKG